MEQLLRFSDFSYANWPNQLKDHIKNLVHSFKYEIYQFFVGNKYINRKMVHENKSLILKTILNFDAI